MSTVFTYLDAISATKEDLMRGTSNDEEAEKEYKPFFTNRSLSYHADSVFYANDMNLRSHLDNLLQFDYLINSLRQKKRYAKWAKPTKDEDLDAVMEYFGYSETKASEALAILSKNDIAMVKEKINKGGFTDGQRKNNRRSRGDSAKGS